MSQIPEDRSYTREHEWAMRDGDLWRIGITDFAQRQLGDVVFVELPETGRKLEENEPFGSVESVKSVSEIYMPFAGTVARVNEELNDSPELLNEDPYGDGWIIEVTRTDTAAPDGVMTAAEYADYLSEADEG